jgi:predicted RNA-binding protein with PUA-like domain
VILNYNNTRLVVGVQNELRVYYPELDKSNPNSPYYDASAVKGKTGWKKVQDFEGGSIIV